jgi:hypothetical protein
MFKKRYTYTIAKDIEIDRSWAQEVKNYEKQNEDYYLDKIKERESNIYCDEIKSTSAQCKKERRFVL